MRRARQVVGLNAAELAERRRGDGTRLFRQRLHRQIHHVEAWRGAKLPQLVVSLLSLLFFLGTHSRQLAKIGIWRLAILSERYPKCGGCCGFRLSSLWLRNEECVSYDWPCGQTTDGAYLVDQIFIGVFDVEFALEFDCMAALLKDLLVDLECSAPHLLPLEYIPDQPTGRLKLLPEFLQFVGALGISSPCFPDLADFSSSKTDVRIAFVLLIPLLKLESC